MKPYLVRLLAFPLCLLVSLLVTAPRLRAQSNSAQLSGFVADGSGAVVPLASVLIVNRDTGVSRPAHTNKQGEYSAPALQPGHYRITVEAKGFETLVTDNVTLNVAQNASLGFKLKVGAENQTVTVDGSGLMINTTDASVSTVIDRKFVENMPLNGRSFQDLIQMTPGVVTQSPQLNNASPGYQGDFSVNGQRTESNYYTVDGVSAAGGGAAGGNPQPGNTGAVAATTALGTTQSILSVDALQEFRVSSSTYSAQYGRSPGGQFSFSTRSGANRPHGSLFDYLRNDAVDANNWFNDYYGSRKTALRQNDFGGTAGGPIWIPHLYSGIDRSFFFFSYEGLRLVQPVPASTQYVPSLAVRSSAPPSLKGVFNAFPVPTGPEIATSTGPLSGLSPFVASYSMPASINSSTLRLDHRFSDKMNAFFRIGYTPTFSKTRNLSSVSKSDIGTLSYTLGTTSQISQYINNDFRLGYTRSRSALDMSLDNFGGATPVDLRSALGIPGTYSTSAAEPYISVTDVGTTDIFEYDAITKFQQWNATDTLGISRGHHLISVGIDERHIASPITPPQLVVLPYWYSRQSMLANIADTNGIQKNAAKTPVFNEFAAFVQDEWHVSQAFTLSGGLRWEVNPAPTEAHGQDAYTVLGNLNDPASLTLAPRGTPLWKTYWYNFAPRIGGAWVAHSKPGHETVLRAGGGVYFDTGSQDGTQGFLGVGFYAFKTYTNVALPATAAQMNFSIDATAPYTSTGVYAFPTRLQLPYSLQWSTSLEQGLGKEQTITVSYVASAGRRMLGRQQRTVTSINPTFGSIYYYPTGITSNYNALELKFQRSLSHGLQTLASYAWSHSLDYGSNNTSLPLQYGNSDFDVRQNLQAGLSWDLPKYRGNRLVQSLINNWSSDDRLMARTAFPLTLQGNRITDPATGNRYYGNVNLVPNQPVYLYGSQYPGGRGLNPAAFSYPANLLDPGNAPRNFTRGFGAWQWNTALRREFKIHDNLAMQFRAEAFNLLNHPNFGYIDPTRSDAQFGRATATLNQSLGSMSSLYQQGGPRSMQFALKLMF